PDPIQPEAQPKPYPNGGARWLQDRFPSAAASRTGCLLSGRSSCAVDAGGTLPPSSASQSVPPPLAPTPALFLPVHPSGLRAPVAVLRVPDPAARFGPRRRRGAAAVLRFPRLYLRRRRATRLTRPAAADLVCGGPLWKSRSSVTPPPHSRASAPFLRDATAPHCGRSGGHGVTESAVAQARNRVYYQEVFNVPSSMDNPNNVGHEELEFNFDDDDMLLNENPAPRPSELNSLLNREHVQSLTGTGSSNDEDLEFHLDGSESSSNSSANTDHNGGDAQNDATEDGMDSLDNAAFSKMAEDAERNSSVHEFWDIINKTFTSEVEVYNFYNNYARDKGFGVRKDKVRRSKRSGQLLFRRFMCSKQGERQAKWLEKEVFSRRPRGVTRCGCSAKLEVKLDKKRGLWYVHNFVDEHNHCLATQDEVPFLRSHRRMQDFQKTEIMEMEGGGIRKHVIIDVLQCRYGGYGEVGIVRKDAYNFCSRYKRRRIEKGDAMAALGLMQKRQNVDPDFYYEYQIDCDGHLKNMFWCDSQSRMDYRAFGDVVVFDSTYRTNKYKMPFVPFVGLNHHRKTTVFGCGIVSDEGVASYVWMLSAFVKAMCQQKPLSIITDGDYAMMKAIRQVLPGVNHRICSWHVEHNLPKHLCHKSVEAFRPLVYYGTSPATFEQRWNAFLSKHETKKK
ncbi:hypothetical protein U9M48_042627, partial [Paspalum notatum var. saurae]